MRRADASRYRRAAVQSRAKLSLIWFAVWSSIVHGGVMAPGSPP
ncbi:MAG: DUF6632 domain-containing protein [Candidatus Binataceae bacterium]